MLHRVFGRFVSAISKERQGATLLSMKYNIPEELNPHELALRPEYSELDYFWIIHDLIR
jgi:hypothetical protein